MADTTPEDPSTPIPPLVDLTGNGAAPDEATVVRPRKKAAPKAVPPESVEPEKAAPAVPPVEAAPVVAAAAAAPVAPEVPAAPEIPAAPTAPAVNPYAQPNPYAQQPAAAQPNPYAQQAPAAPNPYGQPASPYAQPYAYAPQPPKGLSITSMVLGLVGVFLSFCYGFGFLFGLGAVITGHMATKRQPEAKGFWLTGIITGYVAIGIAVFWVIGIAALFAFSSSYSSY